jgi:hypothetical protein
MAVLSTISLAQNSGARTYDEASQFWGLSKDTTEYQSYASEFAQFNNYFHLDEKDGCYALSTNTVELLLVITHSDGDEYAVIEDVLSKTDNSKARCFQESYRGIRTKIPPFLPFVLQMSFG